MASLCEDLTRSLDLGAGFVPPYSQAESPLLSRASSLAGRGQYVDFMWWRDPTLEPPWISGRYGDRSHLRASASARSDFIRKVAQDFPSGPLVGLSGGINDGRRSREYAREIVQLQSAEFPERDALACFVLDRQGLNDPSVLADLNPLPRGITGVSLAVQDVAAYPSVWSLDDWRGWLRLIRAFVEADYQVLLPYSDVRGLVGIAIGASQVGTGVQQDMRQLRPAQQGSPSSGASAPVSYLSIPLLSILHGARASLEPNWSEVESHRACSPALGDLADLHTQGTDFDPDWVRDGRPQGEVSQARLTQHILAIGAAETAIRALSTDDFEEVLVRAVELADELPGDAFKNSGSKREARTRLDAYRSVRSDLSF